MYQKQPPEVFYRKAGLKNFRSIGRKTPVRASSIKSTYFEEHLPMTASYFLFLRQSSKSEGFILCKF